MRVVPGGLALLAGFLGCAALAQQDPVPMPAEAFFGQAELQQVQLSPTGRRLGVLRQDLGRRASLVVMDLDDATRSAVAARFDGADVQSFSWVGDDRIVFSVIDRTRGGGAQTFGPGLYQVRFDGKELSTLLDEGLRIEGVPAPDPRVTNWARRFRLWGVPWLDEPQVLLGEMLYDGKGEPSDTVAYRVELREGGKSIKYADTPDRTSHWVFDLRGEPSFVSTSQGGRMAYHWRKSAKGSRWEQVSEHDAFDAPYWPRFIDGQGRLYVSVPTGPSGITELRRFDEERRAPHAEALIRTPGFDFSGRPVLTYPDGDVIGWHLITDAPTSAWLHPAMSALQKEADLRWPGMSNVIDCARCAKPDMVALVRSHSDRDPGHYTLYRAATGTWHTLGRARPRVDPARMGMTDFHRIAARDGRDLPVWVTRPPGAAAGPRPVVVLLGVGGWQRQAWGWRPMAQFLASRGYVVLEPEHRGLSGYGRAHLRAGMQQVGLGIQADIEDALQWAIDRRLADRARACVAGSTWGGHAALMAVIREPKAFRCAATWTTITDPRRMLRWTWGTSLTDTTRQDVLPVLLGSPEKDPERFDRISAVLRAGEIKTPVFIAMGRRDSQVALEHGERLREAMVSAGNPPLWHVYDDEGHGWLALKNRVDFAERLERFLATHLQPPR